MIRSTLILLITLAAIPYSALSAAQSAQINPPAQSDTDAKDTSLVIARVSGRPITENQLLFVIERLTVQKRLTVDQREKRHSFLFKEGLDNCILLTALRNQAEKENIIIDQTELDQQIQEYKKKFSSEDAFSKTLKSQGVTEAELRESMEENMTIQVLLDQVMKDSPPPTEEEISKFYDENQNKFPIQKVVRASHILIKMDPESTPEQKAEAKKKLENIHSDIASENITFADAAVKYSQDSANAGRGGDLGFFARGQMVKPFSDTAFAMQPGEMSSVVETEHGYHLIQVTETKPARTATLEEARAVVTKMVTQQTQLNFRQKYLDDLMAQANVETYMTEEEFVKRHATK